MGLRGIGDLGEGRGRKGKVEESAMCVWTERTANSSEGNKQATDRPSFFFFLSCLLTLPVIIIIINFISTCTQTTNA